MNLSLNDSTPLILCAPQLNAFTNTTICVFTVIFLLSVVGNSLVIVTIAQNRRMRTPTNMYLLSLATSDLMLSVMCMTPTLTAIVFQCFFLGSFLCKLFSYLQPLSVTASAHTLVVISVERYYAICSPLHSRRWQTMSHSGKMIAAVWVSSTCINLPHLFFHENVELTPGQYNCRQMVDPTIWMYYWLSLVMCIFCIPLVIMVTLYSLVIRTLWRGIQMDSQQIPGSADEDAKNAKNGARHFFPRASEDTLGGSTHDTASIQSVEDQKSRRRLKKFKSVLTYRHSDKSGLRTAPSTSTQRIRQVEQLRSTHSERNLVQKKRVIRMLVAVVTIFFFCWLPMFTMNTIKLIPGGLLYVFDRSQFRYFYTACIILSFASSCANPITYCFLNKKFREAFMSAFGVKAKNDGLATKIARYEAATLAMTRRHNTADGMQLNSLRNKSTAEAHLLSPSAMSENNVVDVEHKNAHTLTNV